MKITKSNDGLPRVTIKVEHRIGRDFLVCWLCWELSRQSSKRDSEGNISIEQDVLDMIKNRRTLFRSVREYLQSHGDDSVYYWSDDLSEIETRDILEVADIYIRNLLPEMDATDNSIVS